MNRSIAFLVAALSACAAPPAALTSAGPAALAGRTAGAPQQCVPISSTESFRVDEVDRHLLLYGSGRTIWANRLPSGCGFGAEDVPIFQPIGSSHCRGDIVRSMDRMSGIPGPACVLGDFVPYIR